jgi:hypothetical protein
MSSETFILLMSDDWSRFPDLGSGFREVHRRGSFGPKRDLHGQNSRRARYPTHEPLQAQVHDKSGSVDPLLGADRKHPYIYGRLPDSLSLLLRLCRLSLVVLQQTAQPLPTPHRCLSISCSFPLQRKQNQILFALVVALLVIMHHILLQRSPQ